MKAHVAFALASLLMLAPRAIAQVPAGAQPRTGNVPAQSVQYGPVARPPQKLANVRKPTQVAGTATRKPEVLPAVQTSPAQSRTAHSPTSRPAPRTAQASYGQPTPALPPAPPQSIPMPPGGAPMTGSVTGGEGTSGTCDTCGTGGGCGGCGSGSYPYGPRNRMPLRWGWYVPFWHSTGDMPQHIPYFPNAHGYYYFHPYNVIHVVQEQEMVGRWGLDPRNPMDNRFLERIYQEQEAAQIQDGTQPLMPR